jgi:hypothetical protein
MSAQALEREVATLEYGADPFAVVKFSPCLRQRQIERLANLAQDRITQVFGLNVQRDWEADIHDYYQSLVQHPVREHRKGTTNTGLTLWLHLLVRAIQPDLIIESGVFMGRSLYTLRYAAPNAELHAFDVSFAHLRFRDVSVHYHECDWSHAALPRSAKAFAYFDDHINNGKRIAESYARGIRHLVFDQCVRAGQVQPFRYPGLPTALMLFEDELEEGDVLEWTRNGQNLRYRHETRFEHDARRLMEIAEPLPSLAHIIGEDSGVSAYVRLIPSEADVPSGSGSRSAMP